MTPYQAQEAMRALLKEMHKRHRGSKGALGFDYGYQQALFEVEAKLYLVFPLVLETR